MKLKIIPSIFQIGEEVWNAYADDPFISFEYLSALEKSDCLSVEKGWQVSHLVATNEDEIIGFCPLYLKYHSQGEYVFDHLFADFYHRNGVEYYPKLLCAVPFTPVEGARIFATDKATKLALIQSLKQICFNNNLSSIHINFCNKETADLLVENGFLLRKDKQFWWHNDSYRDFDQFLSKLSASRRKSIKRERRDILTRINVRTIEGDKIEEKHLDDLYRFICDTYARKWGNGHPYLTRQFFSEILKSMREKIVLFFAYDGETAVAGAINFKGEDTLYGRQWGCTVDLPFLHFEICYYQAIEYAIKNGLKKVEAGTQGEHKLARGYLPHQTYSAHYFVNNDFSKPISEYLANERSELEEYVQNTLLNASPFKQNGEN